MTVPTPELAHLPPDCSAADVTAALRRDGALIIDNAMGADRLARYKRPARLVVLDALPRTAVGKIDKQALKALACRMLERADNAA